MNSDIDNMTRDEFVHTCASMGYCTAKFARQYMPALDKLCGNDVIQCYRAYEMRKSQATCHNSMNVHLDCNNRRYRTTKNYGTEEY